MMKRDNLRHESSAVGDALSAPPSREAGAGTSLPRLDFENEKVSFPQRGHHSFLLISEGTLTVLDERKNDEPGVWLFRAESGVCGILPGKTEVFVEGSHVCGFRVLHHGNNVKAAGCGATFLEVEKTMISETSKLVGRRCPACHESHSVGDSVYRCPLCGEAYGEDCWLASSEKRCHSRNCHFSPGPVNRA